MTKITYDPAKALAGLQEIEQSLSIGKQQFFTDAHAFITNTDPSNDILCDIDNIKIKVAALIRLIEMEIMEKSQTLENN